jgi:hypothetical protein
MTPPLFQTPRRHGRAAAPAGAAGTGRPISARAETSGAFRMGPDFTP